MFRGNGARILKRKNLALLLPLLFLAGCYNPDTRPVAQQPKPPARAQGIDLPTDAGHVAHYIKSNGLDFVARYYRKPDSRWPALSANEARVLSSLGLNVVAVWESHSHKRDYFTYGRGYWDAVAAARQAKGVGQPPGSAIYFAVDFDATVADIYPIDQYFRGITAGLAASSGGTSEYKVGVYGSGAVCDAVKCFVIASGGVGSADHVRRLHRVAKQHENLTGVIIGKALYDGRVDLKQLEL